MVRSLRDAVAAARAAFWARTALIMELVALRHQVAVLQRNRTPRPCFRASDRLLWVLLSRWWHGWRESLIIVQSETVLRWRAQGLSLIWGCRSRGRWRGGRPRIASEIRQLIAHMARDNVLWGAVRPQNFIRLDTQQNIVKLSRTRTASSTAPTHNVARQFRRIKF